jgi:hypothetical protein
MPKDKPPPPGTIVMSVQRSRGINPALPRAADNPPLPPEAITPPRHSDVDFSYESPEGFNVKDVPEEEVEVWPPSEDKRSLGDWIRWVWKEKKQKG